LLLAERLGPVELREWHRRAAEVLVAEDAYAEAGRSLARAGDWLALQLLLAEHGRAVVRQPAAELIELVPAPYRTQEPWLVFAEAESLLNDAHVQAAAELFKAAAELFKNRQGAGDEAGLRATERELDEVDSLLRKTVAPRKGMHWAGWMRVAIGSHAVQSTRKVTDLAPAEAELARLIGAIYGGGVPEEITRETHTVGVDSRDSPIALVALRLVRTAIAVARGKSSPAVLERIADEAESLGSGFVARLALGARSLGQGPYTAVDAYAVAAGCRRAGDLWGYLLLSTVGAIREVRDGRLDEDRLGTLCAEATDMGAESIAVWAEAFGALAKARRELPGAAMLARAALDRAKAADVSGADVIAVLAMAVADPARRPALLREAADRAAAAELPRATLKFWLATFVGSPAAVRESSVTIHCFGGFAMTVNGRALDLSQVRPRARSALRLLAMRAGRFVHREVLIEALWSDLAPAAATRNLQVTISALRGLLEPDSGRGRAQMLVRSGDAYGLVLPAGSYADTAAFSDAVQRWQQQRRSGSFAAEVDAMRSALAAYGGELLPEEGPADWAVEARDHFRQLATRVARELATAELTQGNVAEAIRAAEQCITLDEHDDEAWQVLLRAYARSATPAKALDAKRRYADMLARLGVAEPTEQQLRGHTPVPRQRRPWEDA
jgi:DNA-binding SARP family transcriptional activator